MDTILNVIIITLLILLGFGLAALYTYQKRSRALFRALNEQIIKHMWATVALHKSILDTQFPLPASGGWALSSELLAHIVRQILRDKPRLVVELGSGLSTVVLGNALKRTGGRLVSIESELAYLHETRAMIQNAGLANHVTIIHAPLEQYDSHYTWYRTSELSELKFVDILLVDGPPATACKLARYPALPYFFRKLSPSATVILDDANRPDELQIIDRWKNEFPITDFVKLSFPHAPVALRIAPTDTTDSSANL